MAIVTLLAHSQLDNGSSPSNIRLFCRLEQNPAALFAVSGLDDMLFRNHFFIA
jgi:hypothetical protein